MTVASAVRRRNPAPDNAAPTSEWQRLSTASGWSERTTYQGLRVAANELATAHARRVSVVRAMVVGVVGVSVALACEGRDGPGPRQPAEIGQWIWSSTDSVVYAASLRTIPKVVPTVWIGTIHGTRDGRVTGRLALSPRIAALPRVGVTVRFEDDFSAVWESRTDSAVAVALAPSLASMLGAASATGVEITEVQLDYDVPERLLPRWSAVVAALSRDVLRGRAVWVTSLVSHVRQREYGDLFRGRVRGHILQVFDTGDKMSLSYADQLERLASRHRMPFRLGVAAFERQLANGTTTDHRAWFSAARVMSRSPWYRGLWVFPGGHAWVPFAERAP